MEPAFQRADGNGKLSLVKKLSEVMERSEAVIAATNLNTGHSDALPEGPLEVVDPACIAGHEEGAEAMRAACLIEVLDACAKFGLGTVFRDAVRAAIEGATP